MVVSGTIRRLISVSGAKSKPTKEGTIETPTPLATKQQAVSESGTSMRFSFGHL